MESGVFYIIGTPIGNLSDLSFRALEVLKSVDVLFCEDTRRTLKLLNAYEIRKPLKSCPHFKEKENAQSIVERLQSGEHVGLVTDAGMPGLSDPGSHIVGLVRKAGLKVEIIDGPSALTHFIAGLGENLNEFKFIGFLPAREKDRRDSFSRPVQEPIIFFESPHRIESTLRILSEISPQRRISLGKEFTKISEAFFNGTPDELLNLIRSFKGEWVGCLWP